MKELVESIITQINTDKDVINVLPRNGIKAIKTLLETIKDMTEKYENLNSMILKDIEGRYDKLTSVDENHEISKLEEEILKCDSVLKNTDTRSSFEKMQLDKVIYNVNGYYKSNLERLNRELMETVRQFEKVGIKLTAEDFNISEYSKEYMKVLLQEAKEGKNNSERIKETFEKVYWKCSEVVTHLYVNIRYLYDKYENEIDKFFEVNSEEILNNLKLTAEQVEDKKIDLIRQKKKIEDIDGKIILDKVCLGQLNLNDYKKDNYKKIYLELVGKDVSELSEQEKAEMDENIEKLNDNLKEYSKYCEYKFLVDTVLKIRENELKKVEANKNNKVKKTQYDILKENIKKTTLEVFRLNAKIEKKGNFFGIKFSNNKKNSAIVLERNNLVLELKKQYIELEDEIIKQKILQNIDETSSMLEVLKLASNYYGFMAKAIIKKNDEITDKEIVEMAKNIRDFVTFSNFSVINHVKISDKKDLSVIIKDRYKLFGIQVSKENFQEENIEDLMRKVEVVNNYNNIAKSKFSVEDLEYIVTAREVLKK